VYFALLGTFDGSCIGCQRFHRTHILVGPGHTLFSSIVKLHKPIQWFSNWPWLVLGRGAVKETTNDIFALNWRRLDNRINGTSTCRTYLATSLSSP